MHRRSGALAAAAALAFGAAQAHAQEAYRTYDEFTGAGPLDSTRWTTTERTREIRVGELVMIQRDGGSTSSDSLTSGFSFSTSLSSPERVTQLRGRVRVDDYTVRDCPPNPTPTTVRARLLGTFFNTGNRVPGSLSGDMLAQIGLRHVAGVTPANSVEAYAGLAVCTNSDCSLSANVGFVSLGTLAKGATATMLIEWDKPTRQFRFSANNGTSFQTLAYTQYDGDQPGSLFRQAGTRTDVANCATAPQVFGQIQAAFDSIAVNKSAKP